MPKPVEKLNRQLVGELTDKIRSGNAEDIQSVFDAIVDPKTGEFNKAIATAVSGALLGVLADGTLSELGPCALREDLDDQAAAILLRVPKCEDALMAEMARSNLYVLDAVVGILGADQLANHHLPIPEERLGISPDLILEFTAIAKDGLRGAISNITDFDDGLRHLGSLKLIDKIESRFLRETSQ